MDGQLRREAVIYASVYGVLFCLVSAQLPGTAPPSPFGFLGCPLACRVHVDRIDRCDTSCGNLVAAHTCGCRSKMAYHNSAVRHSSNACKLARVKLAALQPRLITVTCCAVRVARALRCAWGA